MKEPAGSYLLEHLTTLNQVFLALAICAPVQILPPIPRGEHLRTSRWACPTATLSATIPFSNPARAVRETLQQWLWMSTGIDLIIQLVKSALRGRKGCYTPKGWRWLKHRCLNMVKRLLFWANLLGVVECYEARNMRDACVCIYILGSRWGANTNPKTSGCASGRANTHKLRFKLVCEACRSQLSQLILNRSGYLTINVGGCGNRKSGDLGDT